MEVNILAVVIGIAVLVIGPGSGVWVGIRAGMAEQRRDTARDHEVLVDILAQLKALNGRVAQSEIDIEGLEGREGNPRENP